MYDVKLPESLVTWWNLAPLVTVYFYNHDHARATSYEQSNAATKA